MAVSHDIISNSPITVNYHSHAHRGYDSV